VFPQIKPKPVSEMCFGRKPVEGGLSKQTFPFSWHSLNGGHHPRRQTAFRRPWTVFR
jgi:hypothetical protein